MNKSLSTTYSTTCIISSMAFVWIGHFIVDFMLGIWPIYKTMIELDLTKAGLIMAFCAIIGEACQPWVGAFSDRGHAKTLAVIGILLTGCAAFFVYTVDYLALAVLFLLTYIGSGIFHPAAGGVVGTISHDRRALFMSIFASGGSLGLAISQLVFAKVHDAFDGHTAYLIIPSLCLILWVITAYRLPPQTHISTTHNKINIKQIFQFFRHPQISLIYVLLVCHQSTIWALIFLLPDVLQERLYDSWLCYGAGHFAFVIGSALSVIPGGFLADRYGTKNVLAFGSINGTLLFYVFLLAERLEPEMVMGLLFLMGACMGMITPLAIAMGTRLVPEAPGKVCAFLMGMVWIVSESVGPGCGGLLTQFFDANRAGRALAIVGTLLIIGNSCLLRLKLPSPHQAEVKI